MNRKEIIVILLKISLGLFGIMLFVQLKPLYQLIPIILIMFSALILIVVEKFKQEKVQYKKMQKKRTS